MVFEINTIQLKNMKLPYQSSEIYQAIRPSCFACASLKDEAVALINALGHSPGPNLPDHNLGVNTFIPPVTELACLNPTLNYIL